MTDAITIFAISIAVALSMWLMGGFFMKKMVCQVCPHLTGASRTQTIRRILSPLALATFLLAAAYGSQYVATDLSRYLQPWAPLVAALLAFLGVLHALDTAFNEVLCRRHSIIMPTLVRNLVMGSIYGVIAVVAAVRFLHLDVVSFLATSTVASLVLGLALQDTLGNIFAGISLAVEGAFRTGEWLRVNDVVGQVREINWRAIQLVTPERILISLPNSVVARGMLTNLSRPVPEQCEFIRVGAAYGAEPTQVMEALRLAAHNVDGILDEPAAQAFVEEFGDSAVIYALRFWVTETGSARGARSAVLRNIWYRFRRLGIKIPYPTREYLKIEEIASVQDSIRGALSRVPLFASLSEAQRDQLAESSRIQLYAAGEDIFHEGDKAESFFAVLEGEIELATWVGGDARPIGMVSAGDFFGEMALVQLRPRLLRARAMRNSQLLEITASAFHALLASSDTLAGAISTAVAERLEERHRQAELRGVDSPEPRTDAGGVFGWLRDAMRL